MVFVALVIPAAVKDVRLAGDAGTLSARKSHALRLGEAMLNQLIVTDEWRTGVQSGQFLEPYEQFKWNLDQRNWEGTDLTEVIMSVEYPSRGRTEGIRISTLVDETLQTE